MRGKVEGGEEWPWTRLVGDSLLPWYAPRQVLEHRHNDDDVRHAHQAVCIRQMNMTHVSLVQANTYVHARDEFKAAACYS